MWTVSTLFSALAAKKGLPGLAWLLEHPLCEQHTLRSEVTMKRMTMVLALVVLTGLLSVRGFAYGGFEISFGMFYSSLGAHGEWITVDAGVYAWRPMNVDAELAAVSVRSLDLDGRRMVLGLR